VADLGKPRHVPGSRNPSRNKRSAASRVTSLNSNRLARYTRKCQSRRMGNQSYLYVLGGKYLPDVLSKHADVELVVVA